SDLEARHDGLEAEASVLVRALVAPEPEAVVVVAPLAVGMPEVDAGAGDRATTGVEHEADQNDRLARRIGPEVGLLGRTRAVERALGLPGRGLDIVATGRRGHEPVVFPIRLNECTARGASEAGGKPCLQDRAPAR